MCRKKLLTRFGLWIFVMMLLALDMLLKRWSYANLAGQPSRVLIDGFLGLTYHVNTGAAFGFLANADWSRWFLVVAKLAILIGIVIYDIRLPEGKKYLLLRIAVNDFCGRCR